MNSRNVLRDFLQHFSNSTTTSTVTTSTSSSTNASSVSTISVGAKSAPSGGLIVNGLVELENYKLNGNPNVYAVSGDVVLRCTPPGSVSSTYLA
jgi:hypothetical protein